MSLTTHRIILLLTILVIVSGQKAAQSNTNAQNGVQKMNITKKIYGGKELRPQPDILTVTEEIWFDLKISNYFGRGSHFRQRITVACFGLLAPETCDNFVSLFSGYKKKDLYMSYRGTKVKSIIRDYMIILGDIRSRFGARVNISRFYEPKEGSPLSHNHAGWVGRAAFGPDMTGSEFYIILRPTRWLDGTHLLFGKVLKGMVNITMCHADKHGPSYTITRILDQNGVQTVALEETAEDNTPFRPVILENCGVVGLKKSYTLTAEQLNTDGDVIRKT